MPQVTKNFIRMVLILGGYSDKKLDILELSLIRKLLREKILKFSERTEHLKFEGIMIRDGTAIINCANENTGTWLKSLYQNLSINNNL